MAIVRKHSLQLTSPPLGRTKKQPAPGELTHAELVELAVAWLRRTHRVVFSELGSVGSEIPDAIGFKGGFSTLAECKTTRSDFCADGKKFWRRCPHLGMGVWRWFLCPAGVIQVEDLPERWGLIWVRNGRLRIQRRAAPFSFPETARYESEILVSALRRLEAVGCLQSGIDLEKQQNRHIMESQRLDRELHRQTQEIMVAKFERDRLRKQIQALGAAAERLKGQMAAQPDHSAP